MGLTGIVVACFINHDFVSSAWFLLGCTCKLNDSISCSLIRLVYCFQLLRIIFTHGFSFSCHFSNKLVSFSELLLLLALHKQPMKFKYSHYWPYFAIDRKNNCSEYQQTWFLFWAGDPRVNKLNLTGCTCS